jgi:hypothetical protein
MEAALAPEAQAADSVLMVRPAHFGANPQTAASNFFQGALGVHEDLATTARREFDALARALAVAGVRVLEYAGRADAALPDEVFPNNWLSLHGDGTVVLYPMLAPNRRRERRSEVIASLRDEHGLRVERVVDLSALEERGEYLEGTGSLVLDRPNRMAYACVSPRTTQSALAAFTRELRYDVTSFHAVDRAGRPIYHTNVMLALGTGFAAMCSSSIAQLHERTAVLASLENSGRELIDLDFGQLESFAGNLLELRGPRGPIIALSAAALAALDGANRRTLERHGELVPAAVGTIERVGGGSVRCMLAEVALPRR